MPKTFLTPGYGKKENVPRVFCRSDKAADGSISPYRTQLSTQFFPYCLA
jgi:hypothetical protein